MGCACLEGKGGDGVRRWTTEIVARTVKLFPGASRNAEDEAEAVEAAA